MAPLPTFSRAKMIVGLVGHDPEKVRAQQGGATEAIQLSEQIREHLLHQIFALRIRPDEVA